MDNEVVQLLKQKQEEFKNKLIDALVIYRNESPEEIDSILMLVQKEDTGGLRKIYRKLNCPTHKLHYVFIDGLKDAFIRFMRLRDVGADTRDIEDILIDNLESAIKDVSAIADYLAYLRDKIRSMDVEGLKKEYLTLKDADSFYGAIIKDKFLDDIKDCIERLKYKRIKQ